MSLIAGHHAMLWELIDSLQVVLGSNKIMKERGRLCRARQLAAGGCNVEDRVHRARACRFRADAQALREAEQAAPSQGIHHPSCRFRTACLRAYTVVE